MEDGEGASRSRSRTNSRVGFTVAVGILPIHFSCVGSHFLTEHISDWQLALFFDMTIAFRNLNPDASAHLPRLQWSHADAHK